MSLNNITNRDIVNLNNCEDEPIHIPGTIQPYGYLFALDKDLTVKYCSVNISEIGLKPEEVLDKSFSTHFSAEEFFAFKNYVAAEEFNYTNPISFHFREIPYYTFVSKAQGLYIIEFEPLPEADLDHEQLYYQTIKFTGTLEHTLGLQSLCQRVSEEIKNVTGYDRVMIYKFDEQYNGEVFAEAKNDELESFLGLHYPHTDIPVQARMLYMKNLIRLITDINYQPVPIVSFEKEAGHQNIDLSKSVLRSVSPIHVQYLRNMGVGGTLTVSLINDDKLWGLIACHNYSPRHISYYYRLFALLQGRFLTSQIKVQETGEDYRMKNRLESKLSAFQTFLTEGGIKQEEQIPTTTLINVTNSDGVILFAGEHIASYGNIPAQDELVALYDMMMSKSSDLYYTSKAGKDLGIRLSKEIAGLLFFRLDHESCIIWFRNEMEKSIHWAGDPVKAIIKDENGLHPRKSFDTWKELVKEQALPWQRPEIDAAHQCVYAIQKQLSILRGIRTEKKQNALLNNLKQANEELENLHWISTHDLKEPLRKLKVFSSLLTDGKYELPDDIKQILDRMDSSAGKLQVLVDDLLSYSRIKYNNSSYIATDLNGIVKDVLSDIDELIKENEATVSYKDLPTINCVPFLIKQLFSNLIINSIKHRRDVAPLVNITSRDLEIDGIKHCEISVADNGKGFENQYKDLIFQVFQKLDADNKSSSGVGLAICKKIVELHKGHISAEGELGKGATFSFTLPY